MTKINLIWIFAIFILLTSGLVSAAGNFCTCSDLTTCQKTCDEYTSLTCAFSETYNYFCECTCYYTGGSPSYDCLLPDAYIYNTISCTSTSSLDGTTCTGIKQCSSTGWSTCQNSIIEVCDNMDNDCNGIKDDNAVCPSGQTCVNGACTGTCSPLKEICNDKIDNDCDGKIDAEDSLPLTSSDTSYCAVGVRLFNPLTYQYQTYPCGVEDGVCPEHFTDASGNKVNCTAFRATDYDCLPRVEMRCGNAVIPGTFPAVLQPSCTDPTPITAKNCPNANDCVYKATSTEQATCYSFSSESVINNTEGTPIRCAESNNWCPKGYAYDVIENLCFQQAGIECSQASPPDYPCEKIMNSIQETYNPCTDTTLSAVYLATNKICYKPAETYLFNLTKAIEFCLEKSDAGKYNKVCAIDYLFGTYTFYKLENIIVK